MVRNFDLASASRLLDRIPDKRYIDEWTLLIQKEQLSEENVSEQSVVIFRLHGEWLAISTLILAEVAGMRKIHSLPHRSNSILLGVVNLRGQLKLCISLTNLLTIEDAKNTHREEKYYRMIAIRKDKMLWVFPVDEIFGVYRCSLPQLQNVPVTISKSKANYLKGVFAWEGKNVGYLDEELLFNNLQRSIQ